MGYAWDLNQEFEWRSLSIRVGIYIDFINQNYKGGILILKTLIGIGESIMKYLLTPSSLALLHPHSPKTNNN